MSQSEKATAAKLAGPMEEACTCVAQVAYLDATRWPRGGMRAWLARLETENAVKIAGWLSIAR